MISALCAVAVLCQQVELVRERTLPWIYGYPGSVALLELPERSAILARGGDSVTPNARFWMQLRWDSRSAEYEQRITSPFADVLAVAAGNVTPGPVPESVILLASAVVEIHDSITGELIRSFPANAGATGVYVADSIGGPLAEIHVSSPNGAFAYDADGQILWTLTDLDDDGFIIHNFDTDPSMEAVSRSGRIFDLASGLIQADLSATFRDLFACDLDGNGSLELLGVSDTFLPSPIEVWNPRSATRITRFPDPYWRSGHWGASVAAADLDRDGVPEILGGFVPGTNAEPGLMIWDLRTGALISETEIDPSGGRELLVANFDDDYALEVAAFSNDRVTIVEPVHGVPRVEWTSNDPLRFYAGPALADLEADGQPEVVMAVGTGGRYDLKLNALAPLDLALKYESPEAGDIYSAAVNDLKAYDLNGDGRDEILFAGRDFYGSGTGGFARAYGLDPATGLLTKRWRAGLHDEDPRSLGSIEVLDFDQDGHLDIAVGEYFVEHAQVVLYRHPYGLPLRRLNSIGRPAQGLISALRSADLDGDGFPELLALAEGVGLFAFDHFSDAPKGRFLAPFVTLDVTADDRGPLLLLGEDDGVITALRWAGARGLVPAGRARTGLAQLRAIAAGPDGTAWALAGGALRLVHPRTGAVLWSGPDYGHDDLPGIGLRLAVDPRADRSCLQASVYALLGFAVR